MNGVIYGLLHYGSKQTAQDIEIVLGKTKGKYNVFFYDFDKSEHFENFDNSTIRKLVLSLTGSYSTFLGPVGEKFKAGYRFSASVFDNEICEDVITRSEDLEREMYEGGRKHTKRRRKKSKTKRRGT